MHSGGTVDNFVMYNDQEPGGEWSETYGHSKGFFAFDGAGGYWVQHSIPKFPNPASKGFLYGSGQLWYGQHAFCVTLTRKALDAVAGVMMYAYPQVYDYALADTSLKNVASVVAGEKLPGTVHTTVQMGLPAVAHKAPRAGELNSSSLTLTLLGKAAAAGIDMLDSLAAPVLGVPLYSQSWLNSGGPIGGFCPPSGPPVLDALSIHVSDSDTHATYEDHSKWAVSAVASAGAEGAAW